MLSGLKKSFFGYFYLCIFILVTDWSEGYLSTPVVEH